MSYGCFNRPRFNSAYEANGGHFNAVFGDVGPEMRIPKVVMVPHRNTTDCQYTKTNQSDPKCFGCSHRAVPVVDTTAMF